MPKTISLIGRKNYTLSNGLVLHIPTLKELRGERDEDEIRNFNLITPFISTPTDLMVELYEQGIDFQVFTDDYVFFATMIEQYSGLNYGLVFENVGVCNWRAVSDGENIFVYDEDNEIIITREIYFELSEVLRKMYYRERTHREFCNERALRMAVKIAKKEYEKAMRDRNSSEFDNMILLLVNNGNFKYDFESVSNLTIYDFLSSFRQIQKSDYVDKLTLGGYSGGIDLTKIPQAELDKFIL
mgnify:CR=1 FL=1